VLVDAGTLRCERTQQIYSAPREALRVRACRIFVENRFHVVEEIGPLLLKMMRLNTPLSVGPAMT
jgi:hypothetical protein